MNTYLGIVLEGVQLMIGEVDQDGNILKLIRYKSNYFNQESALEFIKTSLDNYIKQVGWFDKEPLAMGVGLVGRVDHERGIWQQIDPDHTHPIALAEELTHIFGIPCFIDNDVKSATRAILRWELEQKSRDFIYIYVGTGIAASLVINGQIVRGSHFNAGEVGHLRVGVQVGMKCPCGRMDCVETIASSVGIDRCAKLLKKNYETRLAIPGQEGRVNVNDVFQYCKENDPLCMKIVDNAADALANLIMNLVRVSDPDTIVLGGAMVSDGFLLGKIKQKLQPVTMRFVSNGVVLTKLNPQFINLLGAGAVAIDGVEHSTNK